MKKTMKKFLSVILVLTMVLAMAGCSSDKDALVGKWVGKLDMTDLFNTEVLASLDPEMQSYIHFSAFEVTMVLQFNADDTYSMTVDQNKMYDTMNVVKAEMRSGIEAYFADLVAGMGLDITVDEALAASGTSMDALMEEAFSPAMIQSLVEEMCAEVDTAGKFTAKDGRLYMSDSISDDVDETMYDDYTLEGDVLTLVTTTDDEMLADLYPMTFHRAS